MVAKKTTAAKGSYTSADIENPEHMDHIRRKVGMYLGESPKMVAFREIFDNAFDEVSGGYGTEVDIVFNPDGSFTISDDGRGLPVDNAKGVNGIMLTVGTPNSGGKLSDSDIVSAGTNGVGASATNAISTRFSVDVRRDGKVYHQDFRCGKPVAFEGKDFDPSANFTPMTGKEVLKGVKNKSNSPHGTTIRFAFDDDIVGDYDFDPTELISRARTTSMLIDGSTLTVTDLDGKTEKFSGAYGTPAVMEYLTGSTPSATLTGSTRYTEKRSDKYLNWEISLTPAQKDTINSFVNNIHTVSGGSHSSATIKAIGQVMEDKAKRIRGMDLKKGENPPKADDFVATMNCVVAITTPSASFSGQDKRSISSKPLFRALENDVVEKMTTWVETKANATLVSNWASLARDHSREQHTIEMAKKRSKKSSVITGETLSMPIKLLPCRQSREDGAELYIVEGDSALGTVEAARDSNFQAAIPVRGKILNAYNVTAAKAMGNNEISDISQVIGGGLGRGFDTSKVRYDKIFMATDADFDGFHISTLGHLMFYSLMPGLIEEGFIWRLTPPLFVIKRKDGGPRLFASDKKDLEDKISANKLKKGDYDVQRCKGLGEMDADDFWNSVMNPETRSIKKITMGDVEKADKMLKVFFGDNTDVRKEWLSTTRDNYDVEDMDL